MQQVFLDAIEMKHLVLDQGGGTAHSTRQLARWHAVRLAAIAPEPLNARQQAVGSVPAPLQASSWSFAVEQAGSP